MGWSLRPSVGVVIAALVAYAAAAHDCPGDLNADHTVTIDELISAVNAALNGCDTAATAAVVAACPGDLDGDERVTINEIITAVNAALQGCPADPTPTPTVSPTPAVTSCPYTFTDNTLTIGASCGYSGPFSANPACTLALDALFLSDGNLVAASVSSDPLITFGGVVASATAADLVAYFVGDDLTPQPLAGILELSQDRSILIIDPATVPEFNIGGVECSFDRYVGGFTQLVSDEAAPARRRANAPVHPLRVLADRLKSAPR